ncbi:MAG: hypothetical protein IKA43_00925 [Clostridia bacterium]|nr:hypothetical protein [Clostridia bacterium]MBR2295953.1 hypothetical protein [Clostridia bacterium]
MNKQNTPTYQKIMIPVRLPKEIYAKVMKKVREIKEETRGYSFNEYITDLVLKDLASKKK